MEKLYLIRHCKAKGQARDAELTTEGFAQAHELADLLVNEAIEKIICSPFLRTIQTIKPLAQRLNLDIDIEDRLSERILSGENLDDWLDHLRASFDDIDLCLPGGESSREAMQRIVSVHDDLSITDHERVALVTHGNLMALLLNHFDNRFGFEQWQSLSNPDVYCISGFNRTLRIQRIWT